MNGNQARGRLMKKGEDRLRAFWVIVNACEEEERDTEIQITRAAAHSLLLSYGPEEVNVYLRPHPDGEEMVIGKRKSRTR